jgi:DNA (cytosine-5)-methyltransferase 1
MDNQQSDDGSLRELALFAGAGGGILGGHLLGWRTVCAVERDAYAASVLAQRQNDGHLKPFPIWSDVTSFDGKPWRGRVDVVSGGFPCQDISAAGGGAGIDGARSGLWRHMARIICEVQPRYAFVENSPMLTSRGLGRVLGDLAAMGYNARWGVLGAKHAGGDTNRDRIWIVASANENRRICENIPEVNGQEGKRGKETERSSYRIVPEMVSSRRRALEQGWRSFPDAARTLDDVACWVDRLAATGNGQVPAVVKLAWETLIGKTP